MKAIAFLLAVLLTQAAFGQRICNSPSCAMCNRLQAQWEAKQTASDAMLPTPEAVVPKLLELAGPGSGETLVDPGCGDGRIVLAAAKLYGCQAVGIEIDQQAADAAWKAAKRSGLPNAKIYRGDCLTTPLANGDVVVLYLTPELIERLLPLLTRARCIVSYQHDLPGRKTDRFEVLPGQPVYVWRKATGPVVRPEILDKLRRDWSMTR